MSCISESEFIVKTFHAYRLALLAIGVKEKEVKNSKAGHQKSLEDHTSSTSSESRSSSGGRTLAAASLAEAWKLRTACCNNLAACHFQVACLVSSKVEIHDIPSQWGNHASVVQLSTVVLQVDPNQVCFNRASLHLFLVQIISPPSSLIGFT